MAETSRCPDCGADLPTGATHGLCPKCLMQAAFDSHDEAGQDAASPFAATTPQPAGFTPPPPEVLAPHFPQLEIVELLGHGGMGAVYKARQRKLDRLVALKVIRPESAGDPAFAERFNREARTLARLSHPNIVGVHDFGEVGSACRAEPGGPAIPREESPARQAGPTLYYFVMEYVDGPNLRQLLQSGALEPAAVLGIVPQICAALQYAHNEGVVHRDIKPENILLDRKGRVKIADFGLAKLSLTSPEDFTLTATHQVMGTPRYMAPEQMAGSHAVDHRADIYSLGVVFYEMLTGEVPMGHFAPPSKKSPAVDARLDEVVLRALASEPERRYQQASDLETDLEAISSRDSESRATVSAGATHVSRPGVSSLLEQNVAAAAGWFGGRTATGTGSTPQVSTAAAARRVRGPGLALMLYGLLLLLPAAFLGLNGYDIADGNDATHWSVGVGLIVAGLGLVGICGLLLRGGWHMLTLEKYRPALLASFLGQPVGLWGLLVLGRTDVKAAFHKGTPGPEIASGEPRSTAELSAPRQILRGLGWLLLCINLAALAISLAVAETDDISFPLAAPHESAAGKIEYAIKKVVWHGIVPYVVSAYVFIPLACLALSVGVYLFVRSSLQARYGRLLDPLHADEVRRDLRGPSTFLIVTGLANWVGIPLAVVALSGWGFVPAPLEPVLVWLALLAFVAAGVMIAAGILMKRLRARRFAMVASVLAMFISPGNLIGLPIGIWSLVVLSQPGVREAFRRQRERQSSIPDGDFSREDVVPSPGGDWESVQNPAIGLFIAGMCYWITIPLAFALWTAGAFGEAAPLPHAAWWFFMMQPALAGTILMFGSLRMKRLEGYSAAVAAAIAPLVVLVMNLINVAWMDGFGFGPGDLIGPPMGLWALAVLSRADVRAAFAGRGDATGLSGNRIWLPITAFLLCAVAGLIVLVMFRGRTLSDTKADLPPLHAAAASGSIAGVKELLDAGVSINQKGPDGRTPLMEAVVNGHRSLALTLILLGADVTEQDHRGGTVMTLAVENRDTVFLKRLRQLYEASYTQDAAERKARLAGLSGADRTLLAGRDVDLQRIDIFELELLADKDGDTPSMKAAQIGDWECFGLVATHMDSILARDASGRTVAMYAAINGHVDWFRRLNERGNFGTPSFVGGLLIFDLERSLSILDEDGKSALQLAEEHGRTEIADLLRRHLQAIVYNQTAAINAGGDDLARPSVLRRLAWRALGEHERAEADFIRPNQ